MTATYPTLEYYNHYLNNSEPTSSYVAIDDMSKEERFDYEVTYKDFIAKFSEFINKRLEGYLGGHNLIWSTQFDYYSRDKKILNMDTERLIEEMTSGKGVTTYTAISNAYETMIMALRGWQELCNKRNIEEPLYISGMLTYWIILANEIYIKLVRATVIIENSFIWSLSTELDTEMFFETIDFIYQFKKLVMYEGIAKNLYLICALLKDPTQNGTITDAYYITQYDGKWRKTLWKMEDLLNDYNNYARNCEGAKLFIPTSSTETNL